MGHWARDGERIKLDYNVRWAAPEVVAADLDGVCALLSSQHRMLRRSACSLHGVALQPRRGICRPEEPKRAGSPALQAACAGELLARRGGSARPAAALAPRTQQGD